MVRSVSYLLTLVFLSLYMNCCRITTINQNCLYARYACDSPCIYPSSECDSANSLKCDTITILIDNNQSRHFYRSKDTLPSFYYDLYPKDRKRFEHGKARSLGYVDGSELVRIDSILFEDTTVAQVISIDYSQQVSDGANIIIAKKRTGDIPVTVWAGNDKFISVLHLKENSLTSEQMCKIELNRGKAISPFWSYIGEQTILGALTMAITAPLVLLYNSKKN